MPGGPQPRPTAHLALQGHVLRHDGADLLVHGAAQAQPVREVAGAADHAQARKHYEHHRPRVQACASRPRTRLQHQQHAPGSDMPAHPWSGSS